MSLAKVLRTRDGRWRVEVQDEQVGRRLADVGVSAEDLVAD